MPIAERLPFYRPEALPRLSVRLIFRVQRPLGQWMALVLLSLIPFSQLAAEIEAAAILQTTSGDLIFETGSRNPDLSGFRGGSRLTYPRNLVHGGVAIAWNGAGWESQLQMQTTGWRQRPGRARNEDFVLQPEGTIRGNGFDTSNWSYRDSAYVISGGRNFADARGRSSMNESGIGVQLRYFPFYPEERSGLFAEAQLQYRYNKQYIYDAWQFIDLGAAYFYGPIGSGNSLSNNFWEAPIGLGYRFVIGELHLETAFLINSGYNSGRDFHVQRAITFEIRNGAGDGILLRTAGRYPISERGALSVSFEARRYFSVGELHSRGGLGREAFFVAISGPQRVWLSEKEFRVTLAYWHRLR